MTSGWKVRQRGGEKQEAIRQAAYACFRDQGYHETSVDTICRAADVSKGTFYWYYPSKNAAFVDILEHWSRQVMHEVFEQFEAAVPAADYVTAVTRALRREVHRGRVIVPLWLEFTVHARRDPDIRDALARFYARARSAIAEMLRPYVTPMLSEDEVRGVAAGIFGAYAGMVIQDLADPDGADAEVSAGQLMTFIGGLLQQLKASHSKAEE